MGNSVSYLKEKWTVLVTLNHENMIIYYTISSDDIVTKEISSNDKSVKFKVDSNHEMFDINGSRVGKDGNFNECLSVLSKIVCDISKKWSCLNIEQKSSEDDNLLETKFEWVTTIEIPSDIKNVTYTITFDKDIIVKNVCCSTTQLSNIFNVDLEGNMTLDNVSSGQDGERDKLLSILSDMCTNLKKY